MKQKCILIEPSELFLKIIFLHILNVCLVIYSTSSDLVPEIIPLPYLNQYLKSNIIITARQKSKVNIYAYRVSLVLSEYNFTFNFCQAVIEKLVFKVWLR